MLLKWLLVVFALVAGSTRLAFAGDSSELVCTASATPVDGGDKIPLFIHFFESRASDGESRNETLSSVYQGRLFQGKRVNKSGDFSKDVPIVLTAGKHVRFRGTYTVAKTPTAYTMKLRGKLTDDPLGRKPMYRDVSAELACVELSL